MAFTPCAVHGAKYSGGASTFFLRLVAGGTGRGGKLQTCAKCAALVLDYLREHAVLVSEGELFQSYSEPMSCMSCGQPLAGPGTAFYGNSYVRGQLEAQWYGRCHATCEDAIADDLYLDAAEKTR
jgi:hypothetical protein